MVVNADSVQVYRDLHVLSARPSAEDEARAEHRLYGYRDGATACSAADWAADATAEIDRARSAGRLPILVGGTGLYLRTLLDGIAPVPDIDPGVRAAVRAMPVAQAHAKLREADPAGAARLSPNDAARVARALEVVRSTGRPLGDWQAERAGGIAGRVALHPLLLLPPRDRLRARADARYAAMVCDGGLAEAKALAARGLPPELPAMRAIGLPPLLRHLAGGVGLEEAVAQGQAATRQYVKRQTTWFAHQPPADWPRHPEPLEIAADFERALGLHFASVLG